MNKFDDNSVGIQLNSIGVAPYLKLMRNGHAGRLSYAEILTKFGPYISNKAKLYTQELSRNLLKSIGCCTTALLFGRSKIFFRPGYEKFIDLLLGIEAEATIKLARDISDKFHVQQRHALWIRVRFLGICEFPEAFQI